MNCETCDSLLLDLLCGELDADVTAAMRVHMAECPACAGAMGRLDAAGRLAAHLPVAAAPRGPDAVILQAAEAAAARMRSMGPERPRVEGVGALTWISRLIRAIEAPQVAMATVMLLVVATGLYYLPGLRPEPLDEGSALRPDHSSEIGPPAADVPAPSATLEPMAPTAQNKPVAEPFARVADTLGEGDRAPTQAPTHGGVDRDDFAGDRTSGTRDEATSGGSESSAFERPVVAASGSTSAANAQAPRRYDYRGESQQAPARSAAPAAATAARIQGNGMPAVAQDPAGDRLARSPSDIDAQEAEGAGPPGTPDLVPAALLQLARSHRQNGACSQAVTHYRALLQRFPRYAGAPMAMMELADCQRQIGQWAQARTTLQQAERIQSSRGRARQELLRLDQMERAAGRAAESAVEAASEAF